MSVRDNLAFGLKVRGHRKTDIERAVGEVAELLGLSAILNARARDLGGSELQRVAIGRTLVTRPSILLLDEPLASNISAPTGETVVLGIRPEGSPLGEGIGKTWHCRLRSYAGKLICAHRPC